MDLLDLFSEPAAVPSGVHFDIENQVFSVELTGLRPGTTYYYRIESTNFEGSSLSTIQSFTTSTGNHGMKC